MIEWKEYRLGDFIQTNKQSIGKDYPHSRILYLDTGSITANKIDALQEFYITKAPSRAKRLVKMLERLVKQPYLYDEEQNKLIREQLEVAKNELARIQEQSSKGFK
jgi:hypothetical protein